MTTPLRPTILPTLDEVRALDAFDRWRLGEGLKADLSLHEGEWFRCHACSLLSLIEGRRA